MRLYKILFPLLAAIAAVFSFPTGMKAQRLAMKTNLLSDAALSPDLGIEIGITPKWSVGVSGQLNLWPVKDRNWKHAFVSPGARYWFCERFAGHFIGIHALGGIYNFGGLDIPFKFLGSDFRNLKDKRYQGWAAGAGLEYGYAWPVHRKWNIEAIVGIGWLHTRYDAYPCKACGNKIKNNQPHDYFGPTRLGINLEYLF